jgi:hypothetical protein
MKRNRLLSLSLDQFDARLSLQMGARWSTERVVEIGLALSRERQRCAGGLKDQRAR